MSKCTIVVAVLLASLAAQSSAEACMGGIGFGRMRLRTNRAPAPPNTAPALAAVTAELLKQKMQWPVTAAALLEEVVCGLVRNTHNRTRNP